jgi:hypothetical protein
VTVLFWVCFSFSLFSGVLTVTFPAAGRLLIGAWVGVLVTLLLNNMFIYTISDSLLPVLIIAAVLAPLLGVVCLVWRRELIVGSTSFIGAYMMVRPASWYLGNFPNETQINLLRKSHAYNSLPFKFWFYVGAIILIAFNGVLFQSWFFKKLTHREVDLAEELEDCEHDLQDHDFKALFIGEEEPQELDAKLLY